MLGRKSGGVMACVVLSPLRPLPSFLSLLFVIGVRGSARAALRARTLSPNTIVFLAPYCSLLLFLSAPRLSSSSAFLSFGVAVCAYHVSLCSVGMTATGSLSRSSSFFW